MKNLALLLAKWVAGFRLQPPEQAKCETRNPTRSFNRYPGQTSRASFSPSTLVRLNRPARRSSRQKGSRARPSLSAPSRSTEQASDPRHQERHSGNGLRLSDAEGDQTRHGARSDGVFAVELMQRQSLHSMVCNRLEVICQSVQALADQAAGQVSPTSSTTSEGRPRWRPLERGPRSDAPARPARSYRTSKQNDAGPSNPIVPSFNRTGSNAGTNAYHHGRNL